MTTYWTDADFAGAGEFLEPQVSVCTEYDLASGTISRGRWPFPVVAPSVTPQFRLYDASGAQIAARGFDTSTLDVYNWATLTAPVAVSGLVRATVTTTRYPAVLGFFGGGAVTRGGIKAVRGLFTSGDALPTTPSTAGFLVDIDYTPDAAAPPVEATIAAALPGLAAALAAQAVVGVTAAGVLPLLTAALNGSGAAAAQLDAMLPGLAGALSTEAIAGGLLAATLPGLTGSVAAAAAAAAVFGGTLPQLGAAVSADAAAAAVLAAQFPRLAAALTNVARVYPLPAVALVASLAGVSTLTAAAVPASTLTASTTQTRGA
ncbi:hypothetical protein [Dactylosporangium sp. CS-033363]|uniref:hypothetical protein n=1 Tax=Dactylosporangium sp. CS-033363 TaxID=3239935 RepID=UPI003D8F25CD